MNLKIEKLLEICSVSTGKKDANHNTIDGKYPFFTCADKPIKCPTYSFDGPSIILPGNGANVGLVLVYDGKFEAYQRTYVLSNFKAEYKYVFHHLNKFWKVRNSNTQYGSATNYIRMQNFADYEISLPPLPEQKRIADILDKADSLRKKRRQTIEQCDEFLKSTFLQMFGDYLYKKVNYKFEEVLSFQLNNGFFAKKDSYGSGVPVVWVENLYHTIAITSKNLRRAKMDEKSLEKYEVIEGDLLFTRSSLVAEGIGQVNIVKGLKERTTFECHIIRARINRDLVNPYYILFLYRSDYGKNEIIKRANTATMTTISQSAINDLPCPIPPLPLQQKFAAIVEKTELVKQKMQHQLKELDDNFNSLMQRAFKGEL